jgi:hypothetical protein
MRQERKDERQEKKRCETIEKGKYEWICEIREKEVMS